MIYGKSIGVRFNEDGTARRFLGNSVVADVAPGNPAYDVLCYLKQRFLDEGFAENLILMPGDSYHMTVLQGINDLDRGPDRWPAALPKDATMERADEFFASAVRRVGLPGGVRMRFDCLKVNTTCVLVRLCPDDEEQDQILRGFRDRVATEMAHFIPKHETYHFHCTLAYFRVLPDGEKAEQMARLTEELNGYLAKQPSFLTAPPYIAYFSDMLFFPPERRFFSES